MQSLFHFYSYLYFIIIFILMITKLTSLKNLTFYTKEHPNVNTLLGNIFTLNHILTINTIHSIQLKTFNVQLTKCFRLDRRTGDLYTTIIGKTMLDSEKICIKNKNSQIIIQQQQQSNMFSVKHLCSINLLVTINNRLLLSIIIQIEDINDNSPIFLDNNIQNYFINESSLPELTKIPLKPAYDIDFNGYNKLYYYLNVISNHELIHNDNPFRLIDTLKMNDTNDLYSLHLVLIKPLDYEIQSMYTLNLTVCDNPLDRMYTLSMNIIHCTSQLIYIHVNNVNDELPWFEQTNYSIIIYETLSIDSEILKVTAYDNDSTPYNRIHYRLKPSHDMILLNNKDLFHINSTTGVIKLAKTILKPDVNNHAPIIEIQQTQDTLLYYSNNNNNNNIDNHTKLLLLKLNETTPVNTSIAYFKITDEDELHNAEITCQLTLFNNTMNTSSINNELLHLNTFQLIHINHLSDKTIINKLILSKNLDAEKLSKNILLINKQQFINQYDENIIDYLGILLNCYDHGMPRLSTTLPIIIGIIDIDEYYPNIEFINSTLCTSIKLQHYHNHSYIYDIRIPENIPINSYIMQLIVTDHDISSKLQFTQQFITSTIPFTIELYTGIIINNNNIDYEYNNNYKMYIAIHDIKHTQKSLTTNVLINILIDDLNDNPPYFITSSSSSSSSSLNDIQLDETTHIESMESIHNLRIIELQEETLYTQPIGYVKALDYDQGKNSEIVYFISEISNEFNSINNSKQQSKLNKTKFFIDSNGALWCEDKIDRELISIIDLLIGAHDLGEPKLTSFIKIRIKINDINDNSPEWQFPTDNDFIVIVSKSLTIGTIITRIHAIDKDESINNGYINYYFYTLNNNNNNTNMYKSSYNLITYQIITQFFALDTKSGELTVKYSLLALPDGFLDIWLQAIDNGKVNRQSIAKLVLYLSSDIHTNNHNHINFDNSHELINYYKQNKSTKDIITQIHSLDNIHDILPLKMNTNLSSLYITNKKLYDTNINKLSLLISTSMIGIILLIVGLIMIILCFKYKSCYHDNTKYDSVVPINKIECHLNLTDNNHNNHSKHNTKTICNTLNTSHETLMNTQLTTTNTTMFHYTKDKYIEHVPKDINNNEEKFTELNGSNLKSLSIDNTTNQTYIPMSLIGNSTELHYTPITSMMNLTDNIPLHLVHVANDTFSVPLCMTHDNIYATIEHNTTEQLTPQSLTIVATVVSTDQMKSNLLPILSEESSTTDVINAITNNKLCDDNTNIKLEYLTHSEAYYPTYTPCVLTTLANTS
ncbi:Protocadherin beta-12 [Schistosoma japonicum]|nr:Protocadherin beta-12 [Schistosoma japonicum]